MEPAKTVEAFAPSSAAHLPASWRATVPAAGLIVLAAVAVYANSFAGTFAYDDEVSIVQNQTICQLWPIRQVLSPPRNGETVSGRPLLNLSLAINYAISGLNLWSYHAANLLIHVGAALLLFGILRRTFQMPRLRDRFGQAATPLALAGTLLWTVHPLQTESVTYVVQRAESLAGLFYLLTLYCVIRGAGSAGVPPAEADAGETPALPAGGPDSSAIAVPKSPRPSPLVPRLWYVAAVLACLLGTACKEILLTAPIVVLLYDRTFLAGSFADALRRRWRLYLGLAATWGLLIYLVLSTGLIFRQPEMRAPDAWSYARSQPGVILYYLRLSVWPRSLCMSYAWPLANTLGQILPGALVIGSLLAATIWGLARQKIYGFLGAWFFLILAPTSSFMPLSQVAHEHRMYLPLAAEIVLLVAGAYVLWDRFAAGRAACDHGAGALRWAPPVAILVVVLLALGCTTVLRNTDYQSPVAIWQDLVNTRPDYSIARYNLAVALADLGKTDEAIDQYREALRLNPQEADAHFNLALALVKIGSADEAVEHYREAIRLKPHYVDARTNLGLLLAAAGRIDEAMGQFHEALRIKPNCADAHYNLGLALAALGRTREAIEHYRQAVRLKPEDATAHNNLALALATLGSHKEAMEHYREALRLKPEDAAFHNNLAIALAEAGKADEAIEHYREALRLKPDLVAARYNLAGVLEGLGRTKEAIEHYHQLVKAEPDSRETLVKLAWLLATQEGAESEDAARAVRLAQRARELFGRENVQCLDTLAAAYAAAGRYDDAVIVAQRALQLAESSRQGPLARAIQSRLELYRAGQPYREASHSRQHAKP